MHIPWNDAELLVAMAEAGSLSGAAKRLGVTQPTVSRRLAELEAHLGEALVSRGADGVALTSLGERMLDPARRMADAARDLELVASGADAKLRGAVRVTAPPGIAYELLAPFAVELRERLPEIRLEVISTIGYLDLARREADLAIRFESSGRASLTHGLQVLARCEQGVAAYASRAYAATLPRHYKIRDVAWIGWAPPLDQLPPNPQLAALIPGFRPVFASDDYLVQQRAAEAGVGAIVLGRVRSRRGLPTSLVPLALDLGKRVSALQLVCAASALVIPRVRAVAELLTRELQAMSSTLRTDRQKSKR